MRRAIEEHMPDLIALHRSTGRSKELVPGFTLLESGVPARIEDGISVTANENGVLIQTPMKRVCFVDDYGVSVGDGIDLANDGATISTISKVVSGDCRGDRYVEAHV